MVENTFADQDDFVPVPPNPQVVFVIDKIYEEILARQADFLNHFPSDQASRGKHEIHKTNRLASTFPWHGNKSIPPEEPEMFQACLRVQGK